MATGQPVNGAPSVRLADIPTLDLTKLTLGEMAEMEAESGRSMTVLLRGKATQLLMALWLADHRKNSGKPRSWQELSNLTVFGNSSSTSPSVPDGRPVKSGD